MDLDYPQGFPPDCQTLVEVENIRADKDFRLTEQTQAFALHHVGAGGDQEEYVILAEVTGRPPPAPRKS